MARVAAHLAVPVGERKAGLVIVIETATFPALLVMAGLAFRAEHALVRVVAAMAADAGGRDFLAVEGAAVAAGMCTACHDPHASDNVGLLKKDPAALCLDCHADVKNKPHLIVGFSGGGHPLGDAKKPNKVADPLRSGKLFYCVACHEPHRSDRPRLSRFDKGMQSCQACHKM